MHRDQSEGEAADKVPVWEEQGRKPRRRVTILFCGMSHITVTVAQEVANWKHAVRHKSVITAESNLPNSLHLFLLTVISSYWWIIMTSFACHQMSRETLECLHHGRGDEWLKCGENSSHTGRWKGAECKVCVVLSAQRPHFLHSGLPTQCEWVEAIIFYYQLVCLRLASPPW